MSRTSQSYLPRVDDLRRELAEEERALQAAELRLDAAIDAARAFGRDRSAFVAVLLFVTAIVIYAVASEAPSPVVANAGLLYALVLAVVGWLLLEKGERL